MHKPSLPSVRFNPAVLLMLPALLATGCATTSPQVCEPARNPPPPAISTPLPSVDYSDSAKQTIEAWRQQLKGTPPM